MTDTQNNIIIFDTTLRDGEQSPGASMTLEEKTVIADALDRAGVHVIEAGFARASKGDFAAVEAVAKRCKNASVCSLARAVKDDIEHAGKAVAKAVNPRIHTFISTSPLHMRYKLNMEPEQVLEKIRESVSYARQFTDNVEWSAEDATRTEPDFLCKAVEIAIAAGATTINLPDTVGYAIPSEYEKTVADVIARVPDSDKAIFSVHCHNDLGLAVANSLAGVAGGARQVECTVNGLGERAGNAAMEEIVMTLKTRGDSLPYRCDIDTTQIMRMSRLVSTVTGFAVQKNKAIVGANAFAHESGIHQDGMLKHRGTYEIMTPASVGLDESALVLGKHSGSHAFRNKAESLGLPTDEETIKAAFIRFKELADRKKIIYDEDVIALIDAARAAENTAGRVKFVALDVHCGSGGKAKAALTVTVDGENTATESDGFGPVDAVFKALRKAAPHKAHLELYQVHAVTQGTDAQAEVTVRLAKEGKIRTGNGRDTDTLVASACAYIDAVNKMFALDERG